MDARFPAPVGRLAAEVEAMSQAPALRGLAGWLARLPLGGPSRRRETLLARRSREQEVVPAPRRQRQRRAPEQATLATLEEILGTRPDGLIEVRSTLPERMPAVSAEAAPAWVTGADMPGRMGRDEGETGAFLQLFARNVDSLSELSRTL
ncbi:MAG: hypothetical protein VKS61_01565 [Candidatus Sericytochromatia bacterium]|nr:hypothetical protein [Candidatus Sericytochromatia bacterium]